MRQHSQTKHKICKALKEIRLLKRELKQLDLSKVISDIEASDFSENAVCPLLKIAGFTEIGPCTKDEYNGL